MSCACPTSSLTTCASSIIRTRCCSAERAAGTATAFEPWPLRRPSSVRGFSFAATGVTTCGPAATLLGEPLALGAASACGPDETTVVGERRDEVVEAR